MSHSITPKELESLYLSGKEIDLIDVRTPVEFREVHVGFARNVPLDTLDPKSLQGAHRQSPAAPVYVICRSGSRGRQACERFVDSGFVGVINVEGGTVACEAAGLPVVRGKKMMSLERQVRIAAGALVVVGAVLGYWVHPLFIGLAGFVGAGLMVAGITDTCAMGLMIARMPWNQAKNPNTGKATADASCCTK